MNEFVQASNSEETLAGKNFNCKVAERTETKDLEYELMYTDGTEIEKCDEHSWIVGVENRNPISFKATVRDFWNCPYCPYRAKQLDFIHTHIKDTHASVTCYKCQECQYAHAQLSLVMGHYNRRHNEIKYQCPDCKFKFTTLWNCQGHILTRHPNKAQKLLETVIKKRDLDGNNRQCPFCQFKDRSSTVLKKHVETIHSEVVRFKCLYCMYNNIDTENITEHMKDVHPEEIEYINMQDVVE